MLPEDELQFKDSDAVAHKSTKQELGVDDCAAPIKAGDIANVFRIEFRENELRKRKVHHRRVRKDCARTAKASKIRKNSHFQNASSKLSYQFVLEYCVIALFERRENQSVLIIYIYPLDNE